MSRRNHAEPLAPLLRGVVTVLGRSLIAFMLSSAAVWLIVSIWRHG